MRRLFGVSVILLASCGIFGGRDEGKDPPPPPTEPEIPLVIPYATRLVELLQAKRSINNSFQKGETCITLFLIQGPQLFAKLSDEEKSRLKDAAPLLGDSTGRALLRESIESFYRVFLFAEAEDAMLKAASLRMLMRILDDMADDASLRTLDAANGTEFRAAILNSSYRFASAGLALRYEQLTKSSGRATARAAGVSDSLLRLAEYPSVKDDFKGHLRKLGEELRSQPAGGFEIPANAKGDALIGEALNHVDAALREIASGGEPRVIYANFQHALMLLVLTGELLDAKEREKYAGELGRIRLILAQLEKLMLKGQ